MLSGFQPVNFSQSLSNSVSNSKYEFHSSNSYLVDDSNYLNNYKNNKFLFSPDGDNYYNGIDSNVDYFNDEHRSLRNTLIKTETTNTEPGFVVALALFLTQIATSNSSSTTCDVGALTPFHSVCIPPIPIRAYLMRIAQHFCCSNECFVLAIVYVGRIIKLNKNFSLTLLNVHRVILTAIMLATKFFDDVYFSNAFYANISGVGARELNSLEIYFLRLIKFQLFVTETEYELYKNLIMESVTNSLIPPSLPTNIINIQMNEKSNEQFQVGEFQYLNKGKCTCNNYRNSFSQNPGLCRCLSWNYIENQDLCSEYIPDSLSLGEFDENPYKNEHKSSEIDLSPSSSTCSNVYVSRSCTRFTTYACVNSTGYPQQREFLKSNYTVGKSNNQKYYFIYKTEGCEDPKTDKIGNGYSFIEHKTFSNQMQFFDSQTDCSTASQSEFDEIERFSGRVRRQFYSDAGGPILLRMNNYSFGTSNNSSGFNLQREFAPHFRICSFKEHSNSFSNSRFPTNEGNASDVRIVGQNNYGNITEMRMFPVSNSSNSVQTSVSALNPAVSHYGQQLLINSYSFRCATGLDKKLFV
ncbi:cyclin [Cryptosporidium ryanae]|uniref:cyclin n=1 Tax=Cryptosporidium ryanae TaxID=515981 RepID=UPI00351A7A3A|nr:cyclin [Cryptosporidium ryanae]